MKYIIVENDGFFRSQIDVKGKPNKYGEAKLFDTEEAAYKWIDKHSYKGMSFRYEVLEFPERG